LEQNTKEDNSESVKLIIEKNLLGEENIDIELLKAEYKI